MTRVRERRLALLAVGALLTVLLLAIIAAPAGAVVVRQPDGQYLGIAPKAGVDLSFGPGALAARRAAQASPQFANGNLNFHGGQVIHSVAPYLVFWDPSGLLSAADKNLVTRYMTDLAADGGHATNVFAVDRQFTDATGFADYQQSFNPATQVIVDTQAYPSRDTTNCPDVNATFYPKCLTDTQLQAEITRLITADSLPTGIGPGAPYYQMLTPPNTDVCADAADCADNAFCAYHSSFTVPASQVLYAADPMFYNGATAAQNPKACQSDGHAAVQSPGGDPLADVAIKYVSHEFNETVTDPVNGGGWWNSNTGLENGDNCNFFSATVDLTNGGNPKAFAPTLGGSASGTLYDQVINGNHYYTQTEWSNGDVGCEAQPATHTLIPRFVVPPGPNPVGTSLAFNPTSSTIGSGDAYTSFTWSFGDGSANAFSRATVPASVNHTYSVRGLHTVTLTVVDSSGNLATVSHQVVVGTPPVPAFTSPASPLLPNTSVPFDASGTTEPDAVPITSYAWDFGDGTTISGLSPTQSHTYAAAGVYTVKLTVTDSDGLSASVSHQLTVGTPPVPAFSPPAGTLTTGQSGLFDASATTAPAGVTVASYAWDFGDGLAATGVTPSHIYAAVGVYTVTLTVTDSDGLSASVSHQVDVHSSPSAAFAVSPSAPIAGQAVLFTSQTTPGDGQLSSYGWDFGDGSAASGPSIAHTYSRGGRFTVRLSVADSNGLSSTTSRVVTVDAPPVASLHVLSAHPVAGASTIFDGSGSSDSDGTITGYIWSFGDGATGSGARPSHTFARPGTYTVRLSVSDAAGASAATASTVTVFPAATVTKVSVRRTGARHVLRITLTGAGSLTVGKRKLEVRRAGTVSVPLGLSAHQLRQLTRNRQVKLAVRISFSPAAGAVTRRTVHLIVRH